MRRNDRDWLTSGWAILVLALLSLAVAFAGSMSQSRAAETTHPPHFPITDAWAAGCQCGLPDGPSNGIDSCVRGSATGLHDSALYGAPMRPEDATAYSAAELLTDVSHP